MAEAHRATVVSQTADRIRDAIKRGRYVPGQRLVEADLTRDLKTSRGPLREALNRLTAEGLVEIEPYRGAMVRRLSRVDVVELFEVREALESEAAALAAARIDIGDHRARMQRIVSGLDRFRDGDDAAAYPEHNDDFHSTIMAIADNRLLEELTGQLHTHVFRLQFRQLLTPRVRARSLRDHDVIGAAILRGDRGAAGRAMRRHISRSLDDTLALPDDLFG